MYKSEKCICCLLEGEKGVSLSKIKLILILEILKCMLAITALMLK